jgi:cytochrome c-type biogenesis protein CcmH/NrfF
MDKRRRVLLAVALVVSFATVLLPLHVSAQKTDHAKTLGRKLMCMCGCGQILTECNHLNCPSSGPMLKELDQHIGAGEADDLIIQDFVQEYGEKVLSEPPSTGFNSLAWYIPGIAFALGLSVVIVVIRMWRQRDVARVAAAAPTAETGPTAAAEMERIKLERARRQANRETEE